MKAVEGGKIRRLLPGVVKIPIGLRASVSASMVGLALMVALVAGAIHTGLMLHATITAAGSRANSVARETALQAARAASGASADAVATAMSADPGLAAQIQTALAIDPTLIDVGVFDISGRALAHTQPERLGRMQQLRPSLELLQNAGPIAQAAQLLGPPLTWDEVVPLTADGKPFGEVRVGVSSALLREQLVESLRAGVWIGVSALLLAMVMALALAQVLSRRMRGMMASLQRFGEGEFGYRLAVEGQDELALLASSINTLGERLEAARAGARAGIATGELLSTTDRMAAWAKVASGLAHEMADPLNAAALHLGHLRRKWGDPPAEAARHLKVLEEELKRLEHVVLGFRRFALLGEMHAEWFDLHEVLEAVAERGRETLVGRRVELELDVSEAPDRFWGDPSLLRQALSNLIANAAQAMPGGGVVTLSARQLDNAVELAVSDQGVGIPKELKARIFDLYFTTRQDGSGIGLAVVQQVAQLHGGRVRVDSEPGEGARIALELPQRTLSKVGVA